MPDAKSLLPGRAFRSEHAQLRPEPHSIASHGPDPMDPLQTTRMRNGVLYAAEWPCCHDPLRLSLGSEDPYPRAPRVTKQTRGAPVPSGAGAPGAPRRRARAGAPRLPAVGARGWAAQRTRAKTHHNPSRAPRRRALVSSRKSSVCALCGIGRGSTKRQERAVCACDATAPGAARAASCRHAL